MEEKLINALSELSSASKLICDEASLQATMHKYDILFLGQNCNTIYSAELHHTLSEHFNIDITFQKLNALIPKICSALNMKYTPMAALDSINDQASAQYRIELW